MYCDPVMAHRGSSAYAPENTHSAFRLAAEQGVRWVETDVALLGDGTPILFHDADFTRCTDGNGFVRESDYAYARKLDAGRWFSPNFAGERIPKLSDALAVMQTHGLRLNLELKTHGDEARALVQAVAPILDADWRVARHLMVSSFDEAALFAMKDCRPDTALALISDMGNEERRAIGRELGAVSMNLDYRDVDADTVAKIRDLGMEVYLYTPNDPRHVDHMWDWGVSGIITDDPPRFLSDGSVPQRTGE